MTDDILDLGDPNQDITYEDQDWRKQAACRDMDTNLFFPERAQLVPKEVKAICASCPVQQDCLDYAIRMSILFGFWGGKNVRQRRRIKKDWLKSHGIVNVCVANERRQDRPNG